MCAISISPAKDNVKHDRPRKIYLIHRKIHVYSKYPSIYYKIIAYFAITAPHQGAHKSDILHTSMAIGFQHQLGILYRWFRFTGEAAFVYGKVDSLRNNISMKFSILVIIYIYFYMPVLDDRRSLRTLQLAYAYRYVARICER